MKISPFKIPYINTKIQNPSTSKPGDKTFSKVLMKSVEKVNVLQNQADITSQDLILGNNKDVVQTMIAVEKADISFRMMTQIRNKVIKAYEEIMRMQV
ncbi:flagellar hook-basal body complex protein FliE [Candidatus Poribacteria bacterium]|nr:flagellar hook-basal body complex protein FliE [Candidatus Poribacteria bacterium]